MVAVRSRFYGGASPASTAVEVSAPGDPDWLLEVELVAAVWGDAVAPLPNPMAEPGTALDPYKADRPAYDHAKPCGGCMAPASYRSPKTAVGQSPIGGRGLFAAAALTAGEIFCVKGGHLLDKAGLAKHKHTR